MGRKRLSMGGNAILYQGRIFIKDGLDNDMTAKKRILAFEIGTFFTRYVVFEDGRMGIPGTIATPVDGEEPFYQALAHIVSKQRAPLDGIAISVPGFIDTEKQVAVTAGALSILYGHEIGRKLQGYLDDPIPTWMENDANCAAMAEKLSGNAVKLDDFALITIDSGVGGALFLDGRIRRGKDWRAGELGMMIPNYETGGFHTMQDYLSTIVLAEEYAKEFDVPTGSIVPASLFRRLDEPRVRKIVDKWIDYLAIAVFTSRPSPIRNAYCSAAASAGSSRFCRWSTRRSTGFRSGAISAHPSNVAATRTTRALSAHTTPSKRKSAALLTCR